MTWGDFVTAVLDQLSVDATRRGIENFRSRAIKNAVMDLQRYIIPYRAAHRTTYTETDLVPQGAAHLGLLPAFAKASRFYIFSSATTLDTAGGLGDYGPDFIPSDFGTGASAGGGPDFGTDFNPLDFKNTGAPASTPTAADFNPADFASVDFKSTATPAGNAVPADFGGDFSGTDFKTTATPGAPVVPHSIYQGAIALTYRQRLEYTPWNQRNAMVQGCLGLRAYRYSISPQASRFLIFPQISIAASTQLLLIWDGIKGTFADTDVVPFPEEAAEAVALYVKSKIQREVDKNINLSRENERDYVSKRLALYREAHESRSAEKEDEENASDQSTPPKL